MARPVWKGTVAFGLVSFPVSLYSAEKSTDLRFNLLDSRDRAKVRYERVNELTGAEVPWDAIVKGYEYDKGHYVLLKDEDFKKAAIEASQTVEIEDFVDASEVGIAYYDKPYFLVPEKHGEKPYALLREAIQRTGKIGIAKVVIRSRQYLAAVVPWNNMLVLNLMRFRQEIQDPDEFKVPDVDIAKLKITEKELQLAGQLIESMTSKWEPEKYVDEYRDALLKWIEKKVEEEETGKPATAETSERESDKPAKVVDIMALLEQSIKGKPNATASGEGKKKASVKAGTSKEKKASPAKKKVARAS